MSRSPSHTSEANLADQPELRTRSSARSLGAQENRRFRVLALDGGGIRGVCITTYLTQLEETVDGRLYEYFDLICSTSTGGIIALAIALDVPMSQVEKLFREEADTVFHRKHPQRPKRCAMLRDSLYCSEKFHRTLQKLLGPDSKIGDAKCRLCIPAVNITTGRVVVFKTRHDDDLERDYKLEAWRVAAATSAAPIYFSPVSIPNCGEFVDGELWTNTPALVGILEGLRLNRGLQEIDLLSIGTGDSGFHRDVSRRHGWLKRKFLGSKYGLLGWGKDLVDLSMHAQTDSGENFAKYLLGDRHSRIQFPLHSIGSNVALDAVEDVEKLVVIASEEAKQTAYDIRRRFLDRKACPFIPCPINHPPPKL